MAAPLPGFDCVLTFGGNVVGKAQDVDLTMSATEIDVTTRDAGGWKKFIQGLKEWGLTTDQLWVPTNAALQAIRDAYLNGTEVAITVLDEDGFGWSGCVIVSGLGSPQPLDDGVQLNATMKGTGALTPVTGTS